MPECINGLLTLLNDPKAAITTTTAVTTTAVISTITTTKVTAKLSGELIPIPNDRTDMPVIRGISFAGNILGSEEFNSKKPSLTDIRCIFAVGEEFTPTVDADTTTGTTIYVFDHRADQSSYETETYGQFNGKRGARWEYHLDNWKPFSPFEDEEFGPEDCDFIFTYDGTAFAKLYVRFLYYNEELKNKTDAELEQLMHEHPAAALTGRTYVYEKEGAGGPFTLTLNANGLFACYEGSNLSYMTSGTWKLYGDKVELMYPVDGSNEKYVYLKVKGSELIYIGEMSENFTIVNVQDGDKFSDTGIWNKVDWYSGVEYIKQDIDWSKDNKNLSAVIKNTEELKSYLEQICQEETMSAYLDKYDDSFFNDNVLFMRALLQPSGVAVPEYMVNVTMQPDNGLGMFIMYNGLPYGDDMVSYCIAQVTVPIEIVDDSKEYNWVRYNVMF